MKKSEYEVLEEMAKAAGESIERYTESAVMMELHEIHCSMMVRDEKSNDSIYPERWSSYRRISSWKFASSARIHFSSCRTNAFS
jgi:hypothetical protein